MKRRIKIYLALAIIGSITSLSTVKAQQYTLFLDSIQNVQTVDSSVSISLRTKGFNKVLGIQGALKWDTAVLSYSSITYGNSSINIGGASLSLTNTNNGYLTFAWTDDNVLPETVADSTVLLTLNFVVKNLIGSGTTISIADSPTKRILIDSNFRTITDTAYLPGYIGFTAITPVTINSLVAKANNNGILLNWSTATELNTNHFTMQHSTDGTSFTDIGTVNAIGIGANSYSLIDKNPARGINYYRLVSVDKDGSVTYSKIVSAELLFSDSPFSVYPNPVNNEFTLKGKHIVEVQVLDNLGQEVKMVSLKDASNPTVIVGNLAKGIYHLRIQTTDGTVNSAGFIKK